MPNPRPPLGWTNPWVREIAGVVIACALALIVVGHMASDPARGNILLLDGDSMLNPLVISSLRVGQAQNWAMSPVLFVPEIGLYGALSLVGRNVSNTLALNGVLNFVLLYGAMRLVAGRRARLAHPVSGALLAYGLFCAMALLESGGARDSFQLASLLATTTYYAMSVLAAIATVGLVRRILGRGRVRVVPVVALVVVAAVSAFSNPLYALWATAPVALVLLVEGRRVMPWRTALLIAAAVAVPAGIGILARTPLQQLIVADPALYAKPGRWFESIGYYGALAADLTRTPGGWAEIVLVIGCLALPIVATRRARRAEDRFLAVVGWLSPLVTVVWAIVFGTVAARYLQPVMFMPLLTSVLVPAAVTHTDWFRAVRARRGARVAGGIFAVAGVAALVIVAALQPARIARATTAAEASVACVVDWIDASHRTGAGQYWTIRPIKARLENPARLVQTSPDFQPYLWLVDRTDYAGAEISFTVTSASSSPFGYLLDAHARPVRCGRYTIEDFSHATVTLR